MARQRVYGRRENNAGTRYCNELIEAGLAKKKIPMPVSHQGVASGDGKRSKRITILMSEEERKYINREARRHGMTIGQFVYALAVAAAEGKIELEDFLDE